MLHRGLSGVLASLVCALSSCQAIRESAADPWVWAPAAAGAVFLADDFDQRTSDWAVEHTPVFGSIDGARRASDLLELGLVGEALVLETTASVQADNWDGFAGFAGMGATLGVTTGLKKLVKRERPDGSNDESFPSGHSSSAFASAAVANHALERLDAPGRPAWTVVNHTAAALTGWARVEGQKHYPSDVLIGAALGRILTNLSYRTLGSSGPAIHVERVDDGVAVGLAFGAF